MHDATLRYPPGDEEDSDCHYDLESQYEEERLKYCNGRWKDEAMEVKFLIERHSRLLGGAKPKAVPQPEWMKRQHGTLRRMQEILTTELTHSLPLRDLTNRNIAYENVLRYSLGRGQRAPGKFPSPSGEKILCRAFNGHVDRT